MEDEGGGTLEGLRFFTFLKSQHFEIGVPFLNSSINTRRYGTYFSELVNSYYPILYYIILYYQKSGRKSEKFQKCEF